MYSSKYDYDQFEFKNWCRLLVSTSLDECRNSCDFYVLTVDGFDFFNKQLPWYFISWELHYNYYSKDTLLKPHSNVFKATYFKALYNVLKVNISPNGTYKHLF